MRLSIITWSRTNEYRYLRETIADMELQDPSVRDHELMVFVDALDFPKSPKLPSWVQVQLADKAHLHLRASLNLLNALNMQRALRWIAGSYPYGMLFEDDVIFVRDWLKRATSLAKVVDQQAGALPWALKTEHWRRSVGDGDPQAQAQGFCKWPADQEIWGTQSYIMPSRFSNLMSEMQQVGIEEHGGHYSRTYGDYLIQHMIKQVPTIANLYVASTCLSKHVGEVSGAYPERPLGEYTAVSFNEKDRVAAPRARRGVVP